MKERKANLTGNRTAILALAFFVAAMAGSGCAMTPRAVEMVPEEISAETVRFPYTLSVGSEEGIQLLASRGMGKELRQEDFVEAVRLSVSKRRLFSEIASQEEADYLLLASVYDMSLNVVDKVMGYALEYTVTARWRLLDAETGEELFCEDIRTPGFASIGDAFNGVTRNTIARERAARNNIVEGLEKISALDL